MVSDLTASYHSSMTIVILPGLDGTRALTSEVEARLCREHKVLALHYPPDLSGYDDIQAWLTRALPVEDYILIAQSFSGPLAIMIGATRPSNLKGIVFIASFAKSPRKVPAFFAHALRGVPVQSRLMAWLAQPMLMGKWANSAFTARFRESLSHVPASTLAARLQQVLRVNVVKEIDHIEVPYIYLQATRDRLVPARMAQDFYHSTSAIKRIDGPHFLLQANPEDAAIHILSFTAQVA